MIASASINWAVVISAIALALSFVTGAGGLLMASAWRAEKANREALEAMVADGKVERAEMETRFEQQMAAQELRCREETSLLRGKLEALSDGWLSAMAEKLGARIAEVVAEHLK